MTNDLVSNQKPHYLGHRARLKEKFLLSSGHELTDYERLEMILALAIPRKDVKPLAKQLLKEFKTLPGVLYADPEQLQEIPGIKQSSCYVFKLFTTTAQRLAQIEISQAPILNKWEKLLDYCYLKLAQEKNEHFHVLYLNTRHQLISDEEHQKGTVNHTPIYPREILKRALILEASGVILVHNHPSGDSKPSQEDIKHTRGLRDILKTSDISIHDHLIIGKNGIFSFRQFGLL